MVIIIINQQIIRAQFAIGYYNYKFSELILSLANISNINAIHLEPAQSIKKIRALRKPHAFI